jgi:hypothetical protein
MLRINNEYLDKNTGKKKISNVRAEINGSDLIQEYCKTNSLQKLINMPSTAFGEIKFTQKIPATTSSGQRIDKLDMEDFNLRVSYQSEQDYHPSTYLAREILSKWEDSLKLFRAMNRVRFYHDEYPIFFDLSIVRNSKKMNRILDIHHDRTELDSLHGIVLMNLPTLIKSLSLNKYLDDNLVHFDKKHVN